MKDALKLSSVLNIAVAVLSYIAFHTFLYPIMLIIISAIYLSYAEKVILNKTLINLVLNPLSGIIMLVNTDKISNEKLEKIKKEKQKIETPLDLGAGLICLSGIILVTTNLEIINNLSKTLLLFLIGLMFIILSKIFEEKIKIKTLTKRYYMLGNVFIILSIIANGYLEVTSHWFSYNGEGSDLYIAFTSIIIALLSQISHKKYEQEMYKYIAYMGIIISIIFILTQLKISLELILIIVNIILLIINIRKQEKNKEYEKYITFAAEIISIYLIGYSTNIIEPTVLGIISTINLFLVTLKNKKIEGIIGTILINIITIITISNIDTNYQTISIILAIIYSMYYLLNIIKIENTTFKTMMNISTNIVLGILLILNIEENIILTSIALLTSITSFINYHKKTIKYENILLSAKITILGLSIIALLDKNLINVDYILTALYLSALLVYLKTTEKAKKISKIVFYILMGISVLTNDSNIITSIIGIITTIIFFILEKNKASYIALLITIFMSFTYTNILNTTTLINGILILFIYILLTLLVNKDNKINKISYLSITLPLITIISDINCPTDIQEIIKNLIGMYIMLLINIFVLKKDKDRNIAITAISAIILINIIFTESWMIGLYVGFIGLIMIITGIIKKEYKAVYIEGIIITLINLLYQFKNIFTELPLWLYIFLSGIIIIGVVTYKAIKKYTWYNNRRGRKNGKI